MSGDDTPTGRRTRRNGSSNGETVTTQGNRSTRNGQKTPGPAELVRRAREQFEEITGREIESVSAFGRDGDGWRLNVEVVELARIPDTTSVLASYTVHLGDDGEFAGYERIRRYARGQIDG